MSRLLFVTGTPADVRTGSGTFVGISVLREALIAAGHEVERIAPAAGGWSLLSRLALNVRARRVARTRDYAAIVGFDLDGVFLPRGPRRVAAVKGVIADELRFERGLTRASLRVAALLERRNVRTAARVLATSRYSASRIRDEYGIALEGIRVVPEPIDLGRWSAALASARRVPSDRGTVLCVAHLYRRKRVANLIRAAALVETPVHLRIVGVGPELAALRRLASELDLGDRVSFLEHVPFARLAEEYRNADLFCLPTVQEAFGIVFLEAMAAGLPVVACRAAAVPEVVPDGVCGVLVPPDDALALARSLDRLLSDRAERERLGEAGRRRVARYDAPGVAAEFLKAVCE